MVKASQCNQICYIKHNGDIKLEEESMKTSFQISVQILIFPLLIKVHRSKFLDNLTSIFNKHI